MSKPDHSSHQQVHVSHSSTSSQYETDEHLQTRAEIHARFTVGPALETVFDQFLGLDPKQDLLDVGTGPGHFPARLRQGGHRGRLVGLDLSPGMLQAAATTYSDQGIEWIEGEACALPFPEASFDVVTARHMLYHVLEPETAISEIHRVLRPNGQFAATTNAKNTLGEFWEAVEEAVAELEEFTQLLELMRAKQFDHERLFILTKEIFGSARVEFVPAVLEFPDVAPVLRYFDSLRTMSSISSKCWEQGRLALTDVLAKRFQEGSWCVSKAVVLIEARNAQ